MSEETLYVSGCSFKNFWQEYSIYSNRIELKSLIGTMTIPFENIEEFTKAESDLTGLFKGNLQLKNFKPALKFDMANFVEHIVIDKTDGIIHRVLFTPDNPEKFFQVLDEAISEFRK
jgi:hypothetical protein